MLILFEINIINLQIIEGEFAMITKWMSSFWSKLLTLQFEFITRSMLLREVDALSSLPTFQFVD